LTQTQVNRVWKTLFPKEKTVPSDLFDLVTRDLKLSAPGKAVTDVAVRQAVARLYAEGESDGSSWFDDTETYADALRHNRAEAWELNVPNEEAERLTDLLEEAGVKATAQRIRELYSREMGYVR